MSKDQEINNLLAKETKRQGESLNLIPSDNFASQAVLDALGSILTNKYAEGYPHKRYYSGQEFIDQIEELAMIRAQRLFQTDYHVNVQPHSGTPANLAIYFGLLEFGDKIMGLSLTEGGHLTHGYAKNFSGRAYKVVNYGLGVDERIDYDKAREIALKEKPKMIITGATAYPRLLDFKKFSDIAKEVGAFHLADISHIAGLIIGGVHPSPFGQADVIMTTTHKTLRGPRGAIIFCKPELAEKIDAAVFPGVQGGPHMNNIAAKAVCLKEASDPSFQIYTKQIVQNSQLIADELIKRGYNLVSNGTDNHLLIIKLKKGGGIFAQLALEKANIIVNKNTIPSEPSSPYFPSGIRLGAPAITTLGMKEKEMIVIANWLDLGLKEIDRYVLPEKHDERKDYLANVRTELAKNRQLLSIKKAVKEMMQKFPPPTN